MSPTALETSAESVGKDRVKLRIEVPEADLNPALDAAYRRWAGEIKVPGFRKGRVPRPLIDARVGPEVVRDEALRDALPDFYRRALEAEALEPIAPPEIEIVSFEAGTALVFEATVDVRPEIDLPDLSAVTVQAPPSEVGDDEVDEQLERLRDRFAELETVGREARRGDYVLIDLKGYVHDQPVEGASAPDLLYELGSRGGPPKLDEELEGNRPGAILRFSDTMPEGGELAGRDISFTVLVKEVKAKKLPPLHDDFAKTVGEFDSLAELKDDLRARLGELKEGLVDQEIRTRAVNAIVDAARFEPPGKLVEGEFEHRLEHVESELKQAGLSLDEYGRQAGLTELEIRRDIRAEAARAVKAELLLEEIARMQGIEVTQEEIGREIALAAARSEQDPQELAQQLIEAGRLGAVAADIMRRKALDFVAASVKVIGRPEKQGPEPALEAEPT